MINYDDAAIYDSGQVARASEYYGIPVRSIILMLKNNPDVDAVSLRDTPYVSWSMRHGTTQYKLIYDTPMGIHQKYDPDDSMSENFPDSPIDASHKYYYPVTRDVNQDGWEWYISYDADSLFTGDDWMCL